MSTQSPPAPDNQVKKCSRCRVKRTQESPQQLAKYATCLNCRTKRRVVKAPLDSSALPNMYTDYIAFINKIKLNTQQDILEHRYRGSTDPEVFKRYPVNAEIDPGTYQYIGKQLIEFYIHPLMDATGYRFPVRDYHKGGRKTKKITFMFICSQDQGKQRKSRSNNERQVQNKLKVEACESKLSLNYSLPDGIIQIMYHHKTHPPYAWKKHSIRDEDQHHNQFIGHNNTHHTDEEETHQQNNNNQAQQHNNNNQAQQHYVQTQQQEQQRAIQQAAMNLVDVQNLAQYNQLQNLAQYSQQLQYNSSPNHQSQPQMVAYAAQAQAQAQQYQQQQQQYSDQSQSQTPSQSQSQLSQYDEQQQSSSQQQQQPQLLPHQQALNQILPEIVKKEAKISVDNIDKELIGLNK